MLSKSIKPLNQSIFIHGTILLLGIALGRGWISSLKFSKHENIDITVFENPKLTSRPIETPVRREKEKIPKKILQRRAVFGQSKTALTEASPSKDSVQAKAGNTLAKEPDREKLRDDDVKSLPIPTEEYLVTQMPRLLKESRVPYPAEAKKKNIQGSVLLELYIDTQGNVRDAKVIQSPDASLEKAALEAAVKLQFSPAKVGADAVPVRIRVPYRFELDK